MVTVLAKADSARSIELYGTNSKTAEIERGVVYRFRLSSERESPAQGDGTTGTFHRYPFRVKWKTYRDPFGRSPDCGALESSMLVSESNLFTGAQSEGGASNRSVYYDAYVLCERSRAD